ncbi:MAG: hypothetical protein DI564_01085 [Rhodanobacter denitrificans]|uniref:Uncharacterized protein n=1 Tax=Rhodanobacter denitrificans TaxID=666685 RepID=A0A2W5MIX4_9GAMM|nr:MAG: hypothetical protein DI564_01085 [Rhodanobacter denitrificans]
MAATLAGDRNVAPTFAVDAMRKNLRTLLAGGQARGMILPQASRTLSVLDVISAAGPVTAIAHTNLLGRQRTRADLTQDSARFASLGAEEAGNAPARSS